MLKRTLLAAVLAAPSLAVAGPYLIAGGAAGTADLGDVEAYYSTGHRTDDDFGRALIGVGAELNPNLGIEALYLTPAKVSVEEPGQRDELKNSGFQFALLGRAPLTAQLSLVGKLSANYMTVEDDFTFGPVQDSADDSRFQLGYGLGLHFQVSDAVGLRLMAERIELRDYSLNGLEADTDLDQASLAFTFAF